jgi:PsbN protein
METATILGVFVTTLLISLTGYSIYTSFGSPAEDLRDPFDEHED